jgi:ABC-type transporter Mla subunit MlaD
MLETFEKSPDGELTAKKLMSLPLAELQEYVAATVRQALRAFEEKMEKKMEEKIEQAKEELKEHIDDRGVKLADLIGTGTTSTHRLIKSHSDAIREDIQKIAKKVEQSNAEGVWLRDRTW